MKKVMMKIDPRIVLEENFEDDWVEEMTIGCDYCKNQLDLKGDATEMLYRFSESGWLIEYDELDKKRKNGHLVCPDCQYSQQNNEILKNLFSHFI